MIRGNNITAVNESVKRSQKLIDDIKNKYRNNNDNKSTASANTQEGNKQNNNSKLKVVRKVENKNNNNNNKGNNKKNNPRGNFNKNRVSLGESYIYKKKRKNPKKFPFSTPAEAYSKHHPMKKQGAKKTPKNTLRVIAFGGFEQVGINCIGFEYNNEVLVVDMGLQFPDQYSFGINFRVPDLTYLKDKKVVGIAITHGHIDHIGGIPHLIKQFGKGVPIFATPMAYELIKMKQSDFGYSPLMFEYNKDSGVNIGTYFNALPFVVDHSIPDSVGLLISTPAGRIVHTGDWKFDQDPPDFRPSVNYKTLESFGAMGVKMLLSDSTNSFMTGASISEKTIVEPLEEIFSKANGRIITATFASIIDRIALIIKTSEKLGRKVVLLGKGMNDYMNIAKKLGYVKHKPDTLISMEEADVLPDHMVTICCTGAQGERFAALMRIATGESKDTKFQKGDTVVFSSSVIPGNERSVQELFGLCLEAGVDIHHYRTSNIHAGGHARQEDIKKMINLIKPEYYMPIYGERYMLHENAKIASGLGFNDDKILVLRNGETVEFNKDSKVEKSGFVKTRYVSVDGGLVGMTRENHLHERKQLQDSGVIVVAITKKANTYKTEIIASGLPNINKDLANLKKKINDKAIEMMHNDKKISEDIEKGRKHLAKKLGALIYQEIEKEPIVKIMFV
ncbi:MAG: ribonuclease J [Candidatus Gracilibacteria bacterium]|nr:ribonuclease J [Candidatus Gracilibacteria bacterium]